MEAICKRSTSSIDICVRVEYESDSNPGLFIDFCLNPFKQTGDSSAWLDAKWNIRARMMSEPYLKDRVEITFAFRQ